MASPSELRILLEARSEALGDRPFLTVPDGTFTFRQADELANRMASVLAERGVVAGDVVGVLCTNGWASVASWFGCAKLGATFLPVNPLLTGRPMANILTHARAGVLVVEVGLLPAYLQVRDLLPVVRSVLVAGGAGPEGTVPLDALLDAAHAGPPPALVDDPAAPSKLMYTSGTTGQPKGVVWSRACEAEWARCYGDELVDLREGESAYCCLPLSHVTCQGTTMAALWRGQRMTIDAKFQPFGFWDRVREVDAAVFVFVGTILSVLGRRRPHPDDADNPVRRIMGSAAPVDLWRDIEARHQLEIVEVWGQTETASCWTMPVSMPQNPGSIGRPTDRFEARVLDPAGAELGAGDKGELWIRPVRPLLMFSGYLDPTGLITTESWDDEGWYRTGDLVAWRDDGDLTFGGRLREAVRRRGEMIATSEIEAAALEHEAVDEAAAVGVPDDRGVEQEIKLCATLVGGASLTPAALHAHLVALLPRFMVPRYVDIRAELPKTPTTRIRKVWLSEQGTAGVWDARKDQVPKPAPEAPPV